MSRKANVESRIQYQLKKSNGKLYATFCPADRRHGGRHEYLDVVIDKDEGLFYHRDSGYFHFTVEGGSMPLDSDEAEYLKLTRDSANEERKHLILDFGDEWFLDQVLLSSGLKELFASVLPGESDTLLAMIAFKLLDSDANSYVGRWFASSYTQYLYPKATLASPRSREFLERLGREETKRAFFDLCVLYLKGYPEGQRTL